MRPAKSNGRAPEDVVDNAVVEGKLVAQKIITGLVQLLQGSNLPPTDAHGVVDVVAFTKDDATHGTTELFLHTTRNALMEVQASYTDASQHALQQFHHIEDQWTKHGDNLQTLSARLRTAYELNPSILPADVVLDLLSRCQSVQNFLENWKQRVEIIDHGHSGRHFLGHSAAPHGVSETGRSSALSLVNDTTLRDPSTELPSRGAATNASSHLPPASESGHADHPADRTSTLDPVAPGSTTNHEQPGIMYQIIVDQFWPCLNILSLIAVALFTAALLEGLDPAKADVAEKLAVCGFIVTEIAGIHVAIHPWLAENLNKRKSTTVVFLVGLAGILLASFAAVPLAFWQSLLPISHFLSNMVGPLLNTAFGVISTNERDDERSTDMEMDAHPGRQSHKATAKGKARATSPFAPPLMGVGTQHDAV